MRTVWSTRTQTLNLVANFYSDLYCDCSKPFRTVLKKWLRENDLRGDRLSFCEVLSEMSRDAVLHKYIKNEFSYHTKNFIDKIHDLKMTIEFTCYLSWIFYLIVRLIIDSTGIFTNILFIDIFRNTHVFSNISTLTNPKVSMSHPVRLSILLALEICNSTCSVDANHQATNEGLLIFVVRSLMTERANSSESFATKRDASGK